MHTRTGKLRYLYSNAPSLVCLQRGQIVLHFHGIYFRFLYTAHTHTHIRVRVCVNTNRRNTRLCYCSNYVDASAALLQLLLCGLSWFKPSQSSPVNPMNGPNAQFLNDLETVTGFFWYVCEYNYVCPHMCVWLWLSLAASSDFTLIFASLIWHGLPLVEIIWNSFRFKLNYLPIALQRAIFGRLCAGFTIAAPSNSARTTLRLEASPESARQRLLEFRL